MFKTGDRVVITRKYPADKTYISEHADDAAFFGLIGIVIGQNDKYIFVKPDNFKGGWPRKQPFDTNTYWHFLPVELKLAGA